MIATAKHRLYWAEWDDTEAIVMWVNGTKHKLHLDEAESLLEDLREAVREERSL